MIAGNHIRAVGHSDTVPMPSGATVVEARGKYLIPGLWDMHVHTRTDLFYPLLIASGVTGIRDAWSATPLDTMMQWWREILAGTRVGPPRQLLGGDFSELHQYETEQLTEEELRSRKARGANFVKLYPFTPAAASLVRRMGLRFGGHLDGPSDGGWTSTSAFEASDSGISIVDHWNVSGGLDTLCWASEAIAAASVARCGLLAQHFRKHGTWWAPTLLAFQHDESDLKHVGSAARPIAKRFEERARRFWAGTLLRGNWLRDSSQAGALPVQRPGASPPLSGVLRLAQQVDMPMLSGTDIFDDWKLWPPGLALHTELASMVAEGVTPLTALRSATRNPAELLQGTDSLGAVAPGRLADLVLLDADPLADITNTTMISAVVANGRYFDRATLDRFMVEVQTKAKRGFIAWWSNGTRDTMALDTPEP